MRWEVSGLNTSRSLTAPYNQKGYIFPTGSLAGIFHNTTRSRPDPGPRKAHIQIGRNGNYASTITKGGILRCSIPIALIRGD